MANTRACPAPKYSFLVSIMFNTRVLKLFHKGIIKINMSLWGSNVLKYIKNGHHIYELLYKKHTNPSFTNLLIYIITVAAICKSVDI